MNELYSVPMTEAENRQKNGKENITMTDVKLTEVNCSYTGGGIYVVTAKLNDEVWIATDMDTYGSYDCPIEDIEEKYNYDYDGHWKEPSVPFPTWKELYNAIIKSYENGTSKNMIPSEVKERMMYYNPNPHKRINEE